MEIVDGGAGEGNAVSAGAAGTFAVVENGDGFITDPAYP